MTLDQLKELEQLNERWANDTTTIAGADAIACEVMDLLPDVLAHVKQLECGILGMHQSVQSMELTRKGIQAERDAALKALREEKEYSESLAKDICEMEDALGFKNDCTDKDGAFIPTKGPWRERVRDLIAKEGELGDANAKCAEMRDVAELIIWSNDHVHGFSERRQELVTLAKNALSTDCGKGWLSPEQANEYRIGVMRELRRIALEEWKPVLMVLDDIATDDLDRVSGGVKQSAQQALAHAEKLTNPH